jgi:outer membrane biosynthesis protein TonB
LKFSVLAPAQEITVDSALEESVKEISVAQQMNEQGMPSLKERDASVQLTRDGMPTNVGVPKPAPIPEGTDLSAVTPEPKPVPVEQPESVVEAAQEQQKNTTVGLMTVITIIIIAILAFVFFK